MKSATILVQTENMNNNSSAGQLLVWADTNSAACPSWKVACERCAANGGALPYVSSYTSGPTKVKLSASTMKLLSSGMSEDNNCGGATASPTEQWYFHVAVGIEDATLPVHSYTITMDVKYNVIWMESVLNTAS